MATRAHVFIKDHNEEGSGTSFLMEDVTDANYNGVMGDLETLRTVIDGVTRGVVRLYGWSQDFFGIASTPANPDAQRETKWLVSYRDTTEYLDELQTIRNSGFQKVFSLEIPTADLSLLRPNSDELDITTPGSPGLALVTAIEAYIRSPYNVEAFAPTIEVINVRHVGRNI